MKEANISCNDIVETAELYTFEEHQRSLKAQLRWGCNTKFRTLAEKTCDAEIWDRDVRMDVPEGIGSYTGDFMFQRMGDTY